MNNNIDDSNAAVARNVVIIEPTISSQDNRIEILTKKKVAAYARVSTEQEEQQSSYKAQVDYYTSYIKLNPEWVFVDVYADEGITGTSIKSREGFKRMIKDAHAGKIDLILTKSISRFARNTVDALKIIRELKQKGIEVFFEKENISSLDSSCEMFLTIYSSLAQEESRSISENVRWGKIRSMQAGKVVIPYGNFLGYRKGPDGTPEIVEKEAVIVRRIFDEYIKGYSINQITTGLTRDHIPTPGGKVKWRVSTVESILKNEKYKGSALLQKTYTEDFLTKRVIKNKGQRKQYYIEDSHPAIVSKRTFDMVQSELSRRAKCPKQLKMQNIFAGMIVCKDCGAFYGHKIRNGGSKYKEDLWYCGHKYAGRSICQTPTLLEKDIEAMYLSTLNQILAEKDGYITLGEENIADLMDSKGLEEKLENREAQLEKMLSEIEDLKHSHIYSPSNNAADSDTNDYIRLFNEKVDKANRTKDEIVKLKNELIERSAEAGTIAEYLKILKKLGDQAASFEPEVFQATVSKITIDRESIICFIFKDGSEVSMPARKNRS